LDKINLNIQNEAQQYIQNNKKYKDFEQWKYTNINNFKFSETPYEPKIKEKTLRCKDYEIILYNGMLNQIGEKINNNISILNIKDAISKNLFKSKRLLNSIISFNSDISIAYNTAYWNYGFLLNIQSDTTIKHPITIKNYIDEGSKSQIFNFRNMIIIEQDVNAKILYHEISSIAYCANSTWESFIYENSNIEFVFYSENKQTKQIMNFFSNIYKNSSFKIHAIDIEGKIKKNNYFINLCEKNSQCYFNGINILNNNDHIDSFINIYHKNKFTLSNLDFKIITNDSSRSILFAKAIIEKMSSNSEAYQKNNNLMMSPKSIINANPQLKIYNDDVKCTHSSTTGDLDDEMIYYMATRGIKPNHAKQLMLKGFLDETLNKIEIDYFKLYILNKIEQHLNNVYTI